MGELKSEDCQIDLSITNRPVYTHVKRPLLFAIVDIAFLFFQVYVVVKGVFKDLYAESEVLSEYVLIANYLLDIIICMIHVEFSVKIY